MYLRWRYMIYPELMHRKTHQNQILNFYEHYYLLHSKEKYILIFCILETSRVSLVSGQVSSDINTNSDKLRYPVHLVFCFQISRTSRINAMSYLQLSLSYF